MIPDWMADRLPVLAALLILGFKSEQDGVDEFCESQLGGTKQISMDNLKNNNIVNEAATQYY